MKQRIISLIESIQIPEIYKQEIKNNIDYIDQNELMALILAYLKAQKNATSKKQIKKQEFLTQLQKFRSKEDQLKESNQADKLLDNI